MKTAEEFLKAKYKTSHISADLRMSKKLVLENIQEYAEQYHAEKQRTDDRDIRQKIIQMKEAAENNRVGWNFPNEHYIEYTAIIMTCDDLLEFISGQIPAKEKQDDHCSICGRVFSASSTPQKPCNFCK